MIPCLDGEIKEAKKNDCDRQLGHFQIIFHFKGKPPLC